MRTIVAAALLCVMLALLLPLLFSGGGQAEPEAEREAEGAGELDSELAFTVLTEGEVKTVTMSDWLPGVVAGEMPPPSSRRRLRPRPWPPGPTSCTPWAAKNLPTGGRRLRRPRLLQGPLDGRGPARKLGRGL